MLKTNTQRVKDAVQYLVDSSYANHHIRKLRGTVKRPRALPFKDDAEVLNELLVVGRQNLAAMENLIALALYKRDDHNTYQRKFMASKRARERRVIALEQRLLGKTHTLDEVRVSLQRQYDVWNSEKADHIASCTDDFMRSFGKEPSWEQRNQFIKEFWALKDIELDRMEEEAAKIRPRGQKRVVTTAHTDIRWAPIIVKKMGEILDRQ